MTPVPQNRDEIAPPRFNRDLSDTRLLFAPGAVLDLASQLSSLGLERVYLVTTGGRAAAIVPPEDLLGDLLVEVFSAAREHAPVAISAKAIKRLRSNRADVCVAIGGGSAIGLGKAIAKETGAPLAVVPTTYSGSEMTSIWGETTDAGKQTGRDEKVRPRLVIYDVTLTFSLPPEISAASGMNAIAHAVESMYSADASDETREMSEESASLLVKNLPAVVAKGTDLKARTSALIGAHLAGRALDETAMGLHHRICHVLGGSFKLPHALTHAVMLPHVIRFNKSAAAKAISRLESATGFADLADGLTAFVEELGIATSLSELGLQEEDLDRAAAEVTATPYANPRPAAKADVRELLLAAL
jgi:maleylacetate reductase